MSTQELNLFTFRPDGTALYLPQLMAGSMGVRQGDRMTAGSMGIRQGDRLAREQYDGEEIQGLIGRRLVAEKERGKR